MGRRRVAPEEKKHAFRRETDLTIMRLRKLIENKNTKTISIFAYALVLAFSMGEHARSVSNWIFTHWLFNYHDGVARRAFVGTIVNTSGNGIVSEVFVFKTSIYMVFFHLTPYFYYTKIYFGGTPL